MVKAELNYNPYLQETTVLFNGNPPRINSLVEKYQNEKLQSWIDKIPTIFHDEMNGYEFTLEFCGTELDYNELVNAFIKADVKREQVQLFHKGELDDRQQKVDDIDKLLRWLEDHPNKRFDYQSFFDKNKELFEGAYSFVVIGTTIDEKGLFDNLDISVDSVDSAAELKKTDLHSTPIVVYLDRRTVPMLQRNLVELLKRQDVKQDQIFFLISPVLGDKVVRVIKDLGVKEPQIITKVNDDVVLKYLNVFQVTEYIYNALKKIREQSEPLMKAITEEKEQSEIQNRAVYDKINGLGESLNGLKRARDSFENRENLEFPEAFSLAKSELLSDINQWKIKKTKVMRVDEAQALANEFDADLKQYYEKFCQTVYQEYINLYKAINKMCDDCYKEAHYTEDINTGSIGMLQFPAYGIPALRTELMQIRKEDYVMPKEDFLGRIFKTSAQSDTPPKPVLEITFFLEKWRSHAEERIGEVADKVILEVFRMLKAYYDQLSVAYIENIESFIKKVSIEKDMVSSHLSEDERRIEVDLDWITDFRDRIWQIERS